MDPKDFVYLHTHSHYSLLEALPKPVALVKRAVSFGMKALALTDNGGLDGAVEWQKACKEEGVKPIFGADIYVAQHGMLDKRSRVDDRPYRLTLLVENEVGYHNLCKIITAGFVDGFYYKPRVDKEFLRNHSAGLVALSSGLHGELAYWFYNHGAEKGEGIVKEYQEIFGVGNYYLEIIYDPETPRQGELNEQLLRWHQNTGVPMIATKSVFYLNPEDREGFEAQLCIQRGRTLEEYHRSSSDEADLSFGDPLSIIEGLKAWDGACENTAILAERLNFQFQLGHNFLPHFPVPEGETETSYLRKLGEAGVRRRYGEVLPAVVRERFEYEFSVIEKMGFAAYFLIVQDYINWAKDHGVLVGPGRGSAAGSLVSYGLGITDLDPLAYGLLFERFLNPDRVSIPDIDTDFADRGRSQVLEYITNKYGKDRVAGIVTFGTLMPKAAVRDAARVLGLDFQQGDVVAKLVPPPIQGKYIPLKLAIEEVADLKRGYYSDPTIKRVIDLAMKLEGNPRHASQHACGIVIGDRPLVEQVPLQTGQHDDVAMVTQFSLNSAEAVGLVKMDFLGLSNLTVIEEALEIIEAVAGAKIDINSVPLDDQTTYELLGRGETTGVFQLESDGMKRYIKDLKPSKFEDIIAMVSLYRPGPMQFIDSYIRRKHGLEPVAYEHPLMENAFKETYGIPVYQEQVMQVSRDLAGFTGGEADTLRKAMGKKIAELMIKMREKFVDGAEKNGVKRSVATAIFKKLEDFAAYGFNKSHAACYAMIAYRTAYLKAHYPACFMAALMNSDSNSIDRIKIEVEECQQIGLEVTAPDVNESFAGFAVVKGTNKIRWGLQAIKNVGSEIAAEIVRERKRGGAYLDLADFISRVRSNAFNKKTLEALVKTGALDRFAERAQLVGQLDQLVQYNKQVQIELERQQSSLFDSVTVLNQQKLILGPAEPVLVSQILAWEKELLGIYVSDHPARMPGKLLEGLVATAASLGERKNDEILMMVGVISEIKVILTKKKNEPMAFVKIEDTSGIAETVIFPKMYAELRNDLKPGVMVLLSGKLNVREHEFGGESQEQRSILLDAWLIPAEDEWELVQSALKAGNWPSGLRSGAGGGGAGGGNGYGGDMGGGGGALGAGSSQQMVWVANDELLIRSPANPTGEFVFRLRDLLKAHPGDNRVCLMVQSGNNETKLPTEYKVKADNNLINIILGLMI
ncbi:MAG: DNA polymerase III subunit alpha [Patescibacteria group bacterium]